MKAVDRTVPCGNGTRAAGVCAAGRVTANFYTLFNGTWTKRDDKSGKFMDVKADPKPFKGVRKEKKK